MSLSTQYNVTNPISQSHVMTVHVCAHIDVRITQCQIVSIILKRPGVYLLATSVEGALI